MNPTLGTAPSWLVSLVGRVLHWYCRGHGSNPVWPEIFSGLISTTSSVVFIAARIAYISLGQLVEKYSFYCKKFFDVHRKGGVIKCVYNCLYFG